MSPKRPVVLRRPQAAGATAGAASASWPQKMAGPMQALIPLLLCLQLQLLIAPQNSPCALQMPNPYNSNNNNNNHNNNHNQAQASNASYLETGRQVTAILDRFLSLGYDKRVRPNYGGPPVEVNVTMHILSISSVSEVMMDFTADFYFRQTWHDPRLSFKKQNDIQKLFVGAEVSKKIWLPDTFFGNEKMAYFHEATTPNVFLRIDHSGEVYRSIRLTVTSSCPMNLQYFPMDRQRCTIEAESYGYNVKDIIYRWKSQTAVERDKDISLPQFDIVRTVQKYRLEELSSGTYSRLIAELHFARRMGYYLIQIYIPSSLIVVISWVSFWLHRNASPARVQLGVTTVLTMTTLMSSTNAALPKISYVKSIDIFLGTCFVMVFAALLEYATVGYLGKRIAMRKAHAQHAQTRAQAALALQLQQQHHHQQQQQNQEQQQQQHQHQQHQAIGDQAAYQLHSPLLVESLGALAAAANGQTNSAAATAAATGEGPQIFGSEPIISSTLQQQAPLSAQPPLIVAPPPPILPTDPMMSQMLLLSPPVQQRQSGQLAQKLASELIGALQARDSPKAPKVPQRSGCQRCGTGSGVMQLNDSNQNGTNSKPTSALPTSETHACTCCCANSSNHFFSSSLQRPIQRIENKHSNQISCSGCTCDGGLKQHDHTAHRCLHSHPHKHQHNNNHNHHHHHHHPHHHPHYQPQQHDSLLTQNEPTTLSSLNVSTEAPPAESANQSTGQQPATGVSSAAAAAAAAAFINLHRRNKGLPPSTNPNFPQFPWASYNQPYNRHLETIFGIRPSDIDKYSRVIFPVCFVCFQLMYWTVYLHISAFLKTEEAAPAT